MAIRYWVGGAGTWSSANTTNWSATSGGAGGASVPGPADTVTIDSNSGAGTITFTNSGVTTGTTTLNNSGSVLSLGAAFTSSGSLIVTRGTFTTNNYTVTASSLSSANTNVRTINLGSSTVSLSGSVAVDFSTSTSLTFNAGTSQIDLTRTAGSSLAGGGLTFYNVSSVSIGISGTNTFNNLSVSGRTSSGITASSVSNNQTINGTLTLSAGTNATCRTLLQSNIFGETRTLTCAAVASLTDIDFQDITVAGAAAPVSGTRLGDCKGNSGITFGAGVTRYWNLAGGGNWSSTGWAATSGGAPSDNNFPLAQDTAVFEATGLNSGATITVNANYNIGTINMSARTSNTMTLATSSNTPTIYGNWINGTGTTLTGDGTVTFAGRGSQTLTSAGKTFTSLITVATPGGSVQLLDALTSSNDNPAAFRLNAGTFDANGYNVTLSGTSGGVLISTSSTKVLALGSGTWTIAGSAGFEVESGGLDTTVTGTGTISLTSSSAKAFRGGGVKTYPTLNQGGAGTLTITGSNTFANITNTYAATGATSVLFEFLSVNTFKAFNLTGQPGRVCSLGTTVTFIGQATLRKDTPWYMGANSIDNGNNTGLTFIAGGGIDYLSISYIKGVTTGAGNFFAFF